MTLCSFKGNEHISNKDFLLRQGRELWTIFCPTYILRKKMWVPENRAPPADLISQVADSGLPWFIKDSRADYATGITIVSNPLSALERDDVKEDKVYVVQPHIQRPLLYGGLKFHIRQYFFIWRRGIQTWFVLFVYVEGWLALARELSHKTSAPNEEGEKSISADQNSNDTYSRQFISRDRVSRGADGSTTLVLGRY